MDLHIRDMQEDDLERVFAIETAAKPFPWSKKMLAAELLNRPVSRPRVAVADGQIAGFLMAWHVADEVHIVNIVVDPQFQRRGIGRRLMLDVLERGRESGARRAYLEVRERNQPAIRLYESLKFEPIGRRRGYYMDSGEDAIVMQKQL